MIDVDHFKQINDQFGHMTGDLALKDMANVLRAACSQGTSNLFICRYGGDEFLIAGFGCPPDEISSLKSHIQEKLDSINGSHRNPYTLEVSIGTASGKCSTINDVKKLLHNADTAMYREKNSQAEQKVR